MEFEYSSVLAVTSYMIVRNVNEKCTLEWNVYMEMAIDSLTACYACMNE